MSRTNWGAIRRRSRTAPGSSRLLEDGTRLAAAQGEMNREAVHRGLREALNGFLDALGHGACPTTTYVGLRGISLKDMDTADVGVGVLRRLTQEEVRSFVTEEDAQPVREDELCLVLTSEATWSVTDAPPKPAGGGVSGVLSRLDCSPL